MNYKELRTAIKHARKVYVYVPIIRTYRPLPKVDAYDAVAGFDSHDTAHIETRVTDHNLYFERTIRDWERG